LALLKPLFMLILGNLCLLYGLIRQSEFKQMENF